jgi:hypothetical protein
MSWSICPLSGGNNLEGILSISLVADLWDHVSSPQGAGLLCCPWRMGYWLTHLNFRFLDPTRMTLGVLKNTADHYTPLRMAQVHSTQCCGAIETLIHCWQEYKMALAILKISFLQNWSIQSSYCAPWYLPRWAENTCLNKNLHTDVYSRFIHNFQNLKVPRYPLAGE